MAERNSRRLEFVLDVLVGQEVDVTVRSFAGGRVRRVPGLDRFSLARTLAASDATHVRRSLFVQMRDGSVYRGVMESCVDGELRLGVARLMFDGQAEVKFARPEGQTKMIASGGWEMITATEVKIGAADLGPVGAMDDAGGFGTDSAISRGRGGREGRALEKWNMVGDAGGTAGPVGGLEEMDAKHRGWDQFALNEARFGVKTDYKEELYTTELDYSKSRISVAEANRIAREIEQKGAGTTNIHLMEERGVDVDIDEEALYGAVIRDDTGAQARPPHRAAMVAPGAKWADKVKGVAGVAGKNLPQSHAIAIDPRRETNKLRAQMSSSRTSSPYGTPNFNQSPLVGDAKMLEALNLDPGVGSSKITDETRDQFEAFKRHQAKRVSVKTASGDGTSKGGNDGSSTTAKKTTLNPNAKSFSFNVGAKEFSPAPKEPPAGQTPPPPPPGEIPPHMGMNLYNGVAQYAPQYPMPSPYGGYPGRGMGPMMYAPTAHLYAPVMLTHQGGPGRGGHPTRAFGNGYPGQATPEEED